MSETRTRKRLETSALVVGYAMSRLDTEFLGRLGFGSWSDAYDAFGRSLEVPPKSIKALRDEYDPIHPNPRRGWVGRPMIAGRARVAEDLRDISDPALLELVRALLRGDFGETSEALDSLAQEQRPSTVAAERLLTGRRAEEFILEACQQVLGVPRTALIDRRDDLVGFDFEISDDRQLVVEVKGLRATRGDILFTDREWREATARRQRYWVAIVGDVLAAPHARICVDPTAHLPAKCVYETTVSARWRAAVDVAA